MRRAARSDTILVQTRPIDLATASARTGEPIIAAHGVVKRYDGTLAVDGLDLTVWPGEIFGILGPNGAGKTTTLEMLEGLRAPDAGTMRVAGFDPVSEPERLHQVIGVQLQTTALFDYLNCSEIVALFAALYGADASAVRVEQLLALVGLEEKQRARVNTLSGGQKQRLAVALALVNTPRITFLDEPTTGLDPVARRGLWQTVRDVRAAGATVVLTTHYMEEAEQLCDRIAIMDRGRVVACDTPRALINDLGADATIRAETRRRCPRPGAFTEPGGSHRRRIAAARRTHDPRATHGQRASHADRPARADAAPRRHSLRPWRRPRLPGRRLPGANRTCVRG